MINLYSFKQVEPSNLLGLTMGWVVAQAPVKFTPEDTYGVATVDKGGHKFIENGIICSLDKDGNIVNYEEGKRPFLHFTEELNTIIDANEYFAVPCEGADTYLRLVALVEGSEFVTDNYTGSLSGNAGYATVTAGVLAVSDSQTSPESKLNFRVEKTMLPNGKDAIAVKYIG